jgi:hypothetical protein
MRARPSGSAAREHIMSKQVVRRSTILIGAFAIGALIVISTITSVRALENISVLDGITACYSWCEKHNPPGNSRNACMNQCRKYWYCNGKDAASYTLNCKYYRGTAKLSINPQTGQSSPGIDTSKVKGRGAPATR